MLRGDRGSGVRGQCLCVLTFYGQLGDNAMLSSVSEEVSPSPANHQD